MSLGTRPTRPRRARARVVALFIALVVALVGTIASPGATASSSTSPARALGPPASSANARYLTDAYDALLGRTVDAAGLDYQLNVIKAGGDQSRRLVTYGLLFSAEGSRQEVQRAYDELLRRAPEAGGEQYWTTHLQGHGVLDLRVLLLASDEYHVRAGGVDAPWLEAVYRDVLGRSTDANGRAYWFGQLASGVPRPLIVARVYLSDEALGKRVDAYYAEALGRSPAADERADAIRVIRVEGERGFRAQIWASDERFERYLEPVVG